jgi:hypothetical protein
MKYLSLILAVGLVVAAISTALAQSPGDTVGLTDYPFQANGSTGHRIAVDNAGNAHFTWTGGTAYPSIRQIFYNYYGAGSFTWPDLGTSISYRNGDGFPQIAVENDDREIIVYHNAAAGAESLICAIDAAPGLAYFAFRHPPNRLSGNSSLLWPYMTVDRINRIHVVATTFTDVNNDPQPFGYTRSTDSGNTWTALAVVDTIRTVSPVIVSSPVSAKVAIVYCHPTDSTKLRNDVFYIQSEDGITWDFINSKINLTEYGQNGDSLFAYTDLAAAYDFNDNLHIVWNARYVVGTRESNRVFLYHTNTNWDYNSEITYVDFSHTSRCQIEGGNLALNKMSIAADSAHNLLYTVYTVFDTSDCAANNSANGEIYFQQSQDDGVSWSAPLDLTNSHTPNCLGPDCASDIYPSLAERVDDYMHLFYECYRWPTQIEPASSILLYLRLPAGGVSVADEPLPSSFEVSQNYPNPFNARTTIKYSLKEKGTITLSIYNITGQRVAKLMNETQEAGKHQVIWDAGNFSSGIYFARLEASGESRDIRMTMIK